MNKAGRIEKLEQEILKQKVCADLAAQATQLVMGDGNLDSQIVFVGEAPGKNEDLQGKPFVGASGKFLTRCWPQWACDAPMTSISPIC